MAGHSKWANIKHRKARQDAKKGKQWSKASRAIIVAARNGGGDPDTNLTLRYAIDDAKSVNMPKDTIEKAVAKGSGELGGEDFQPVLYEGYGPNGVAIMVETLTDNKNRTAGEVRHAFDKSGGKLGANGSVSYLFTQKGLIAIPKEVAGEDHIMEVALEAGAEDVIDQDDAWQVETDPGAYREVRQAIKEAGFDTTMSELAMVPDNTVECTGDDARKVMGLIDKLEDLDDVQRVHANEDIPEQDLAALES